MKELKEILTLHKAVFPLLVVVLALLALLMLLITFFASKQFFSKCEISARRKQVLTCLLVLIMFFVIILVVFGPILYDILYQSAAAKPDANAKAILSSAISGTLYFVLAVLFVATALILIVAFAWRQHESFFTTKTITRLAVFSALSTVLYFVKFNLPAIFPGFLEIHISDMPALLAGFMMGPLSGAVVIIIRAFIKLPFTSTGGVGELGDLLLGMVFVLSSAIVYKKIRTKKGALIALIVGGISCSLAAIAVNRFILIPFFATLYSWNAVLGMVSHLYPNITQDNFYSYFLLVGTLPFNILRCILSCLTTFFLYKPIKLAFGFVEKKRYKKDSKKI